MIIIKFDEWLTGYKESEDGNYIKRIIDIVVKDILMKIAIKNDNNYIG